MGPVRVRKLVKYFGSPQDILAANTKSLQSVSGVGEMLAGIISQWESHVDLQSELSDAKQRGIKIITREDAEYPKNLLETYDAPLVLYVWGDLDPIDNHGIAIVGSRDYTHYGQRCSRQFGFQLASAGVSVISGLARGIDTFAHEGAIAAKGRTIAVIGSGLAQLYPAENHTLAEKIADGYGAVVSEYPLHTRPDKRTFPMRNRVVAGWSTGVVVIESPKWSGSQITANLANEMGKTVFAVPGAIDSPSSAGCHELIRNGATLVSSAADILSDREILPLFNEAKVTSTPAIANLTPTEQEIYNILGTEPLIVDQIMQKISIPLSQLNVTLLQLELKRLIKQLPGQQYLRC